MHLAALFQGSKHHEFEQRQSTLMHRETPSEGRRRAIEWI
ncbi:DUF6191 domain-containing protein [Nocardia sp. NPDC058176]